MDWFLYDNRLRHERVKDKKEFSSKINCRQFLPFLYFYHDTRFQKELIDKFWKKKLIKDVQTDKHEIIGPHLLGLQKFPELLTLALQTA